MFKYFFVEASHLPDGVGFDLYSLSHLMWLFIITLSIILVSIKYKKMPQPKRNVFRKILGTIILFTEVYYQFVLIVTKQYNINYLPLHLCGLAIFIYFCDSFKANDVIRDFIYCLCLPGAFMALMFPNWCVYPIFNFAAINSFLLHGLLILYPVMIMHSGEFVPDYMNLPKCTCWLVSFAVPIYIFNKIFNTNFLFINTPSEGSPLVIFERWFGNPGYILGMFMMLIVVWLMLYIPVVVRNLHIKKEELIEI